MIGAEVFGPFVVASLTFVVLIVGHFLFGVIRTVVERGVPLWAVLQFIWYQTPNALALALPVSMLLAAALAMHRLARDNELVAMRAAGVSWGRILLPVWVVGLLVSGLSFFIAEVVQPRADRRARGIVTSMWMSQKTLAMESGRFAPIANDMWVLPGEVDDRTGTISGLRMFWMQPKGPVWLYQAESGRLHGDYFDLERPAIYRLDPSGGLTYSPPAPRARLYLPETVKQFAGEQTAQQNLSIVDLGRQIRSRREDNSLPATLGPLVFQFHHRISMALACLAFSLVGAPLALMFRGGVSVGGVLIAVLFAFVYYVGMLWARMLGLQGVLPPAAAAWLPNVVTVVVGVLLLWRRC